MSILIASFPEVREISKKIAKDLRADYTEIDVGNFPDSEFHLALKKNPKDRVVVIVNSLCRNPDSKLIETVLAGGIARDYNAKKVILVATYFPYLRQDTHFLKYDSFSSKYIVKLFSHFDKIITIDPHLHRIKKMRQWSSKAVNISAKGLVTDYIKKKFKNDFTILGPDSESVQWSAPIAKALGKNVVVLNKTRFSSTHIKVKDKKEDKFGKNVIIVDDIISTGKTIAGALALAKERGARNLICIGIHGVLVNDADELITKYAKLITTNTVPNRYAQIDVSPAISDYLKKHLKNF